MIPGETALLAKRVRLVMELRRGGVSDARVLGIIEKTPRDLFIDPVFWDQAYENVALPIDNGQTVSQPLIVGQMTELLELGEREKVLEIGTGSGYHTAILARLVRRVFTIERHRDLLRAAERRFEQLNLRNIITRFADGSKGWPEQAPFDRILITAACPELPNALLKQLAPGGVLVGPIGEAYREQRLVRIRRVEDGLESEDHGPVRFVPLVTGLPRPLESEARAVDGSVVE